MRFVLDVSACESVEDLHRALAEGLHFPAWYSGNLDALHDCLTDLHEPTELIVRGTSALDELLGRRANASAACSMTARRKIRISPCGLRTLLKTIPISFYT